MKNLISVILLILIVQCFFSSCSDSNKEHKYVEMTELDFGEGTYRPNPFKFLDNIPPFSWMGMPDSVKRETELEITFNEDAIRSLSSGQLAFVDQNGNKVNGIEVGNKISDKITIDAKEGNAVIPVRFTVNPEVGDSVLQGSLVVIGNELDQVNEVKLSSMATPIASWSLTHKNGINWWRWMLLIGCIAIVMYMLYLLGGLIYRVIVAVLTTIPNFFLLLFKFNNKRRNNKKYKKVMNRKNDILDTLLFLEKKLYQNLMIYVKYETLETMRIILDELYNIDRPTWSKAKQALKENTWDALEEAWKLWDPTPSRNVNWEGPDNRDCILKDTHPLYYECKSINHIKCHYDEHGAPDFNPVTYPGSVVNITDLYDKLSSYNIKERGKGPNSLQVIAQERMIPSLRKTIEKWAKENNCAPDFWKWRDSLNLVPHEDPNCRSMRLVDRRIHKAFTHRGGVANAINIKNHFS